MKPTTLRMTLSLAVLAVLSGSLSAAPVEFDTADAHVLVIRAIDSWSSDKARNEDSLDTIREKLVAFMYADEAGQIHNGGPTSIFSSRNSISDPLAKAVDAQLQELKADYSSKSINYTYFLAPRAIAPADMKAFAAAERQMFEAAVIQNGNPATAEARTGVRKILGGLASTALTLFSMGKLGGRTGSAFMLGSGMTGDVDRAFRIFGKALVPLPLPDVDLSGYKSIDVRSVMTNDQNRVGQILIAYRGDKTPEAENIALAKAIVTSFGVDVPVAEIEQARAADLALRQGVWDRCVSDGKCKAE